MYPVYDSKLIVDSCLSLKYIIKYDSVMTYTVGNLKYCFYRPFS